MTQKLKLLDLFCCSGGSSYGYHLAGFEVTGVDIKPQPRYPFSFIRADALEFPLDGFDVIAASPPCQAYSATRHSHPERKHPMLIEETRTKLVASGKPYIIENVIGAPLIDPLMLCGTMFGLNARDADDSELFLKRHRIFESNLSLVAPSECRCSEYRSRGMQCAGVYGGGRHRRTTSARGGYTPLKSAREDLMGIDWMTLEGLSQAIPPSYTECLGLQARRLIQNAT